MIILTFMANKPTLNLIEIIKGTPFAGLKPLIEGLKIEAKIITVLDDDSLDKAVEFNAPKWATHASYNSDPIKDT